MSYNYKVLKDHPIAFWSLDDSTTTAIDISGCGNNGTYTGASPGQNNIMPLVSGGSYSAKITSTSSIELPVDNDYYQNQSGGGFATKYTSDNDFTIECWILPKIYSTNETVIVADTSNDIGIFWQNSNLIFKLGSEYLEYTLVETNKSIYIACTYAVNSASIYIDGDLVVTKLITQNPFQNTEILFNSGPTTDLEDNFLIDNIAIYRYALSQKNIKNHYISNESTVAIQVAYPDNGEIFNIYDNGMRTSFNYNYPKDKSWEYFLTDELSLNRLENYIEITKTESLEIKEVVIEDIITIPSGISMDSSKIEWVGSNGVSVYTSLDGDTYEQCSNGDSIPQYTYSDFNEQKFMYLKIVIESSDSSKYLPKLYSLSVNFYSEQILYSKNGSSYISKIQDKDFALGNEVYKVLSSNSLNGVVTPENSGFKITASYDVNSIEFLYIPNSISQSLLISATDTEFSWSNNGTLSKNNILKIYVNGIDKTSETGISNILKSGFLNHIVIVLDEPVTGDIVFNYKSSGCQKATYQHITLYKDQLQYNEIINHYLLYTGKSSYTTPESSMAMTENSASLYNNDWLVVQNS